MKIELEIERVGVFGQGVGKDSAGNVYFVLGALPGDKVLAEYERDAKRFRDATLVSLLSPSPDRLVEPACKFFPECGGCDWLHWDYGAQLKAKSEILEHTLRRNGVEFEEFLSIQGSPKPLGYRNRIQVREENGQLGFYRRKSHDIVPIDACAVAHPKLNKAIQSLRGQTHVGRRKLELSLQEDGSVTVSENERHAVRGFAQINAEQNEYLRQRIKGLIEKKGAQYVLELYCGDGNFSFSGAEKVKRWIGIDNSHVSINRARELREDRGMSQLSFFPFPVDKKLWGKLPEDFTEQCDTLILDPPRDGVQGALTQFLETGIQRIFYISCSPVSFSKDAQDLKKAFRLTSVQPIDMFPQTRHVELVALFERR